MLLLFLTLARHAYDGLAARGPHWGCRRKARFISKKTAIRCVVICSGAVWRLPIACLLERVKNVP